MKRLVCLVLAFVMVLSMTACGKDKKQEAKEYDGAALLQAMLEQVKFSDTMTSVGEFASLYFPDLPESAKIEMYTGSGYYADELVLISVSDASDMEAVKASVDVHMEQLTAQFKNYIPEEVAKIEKAIVWQGGSHTIVCISNDYATAQKILNEAENAGTEVEAPVKDEPAADAPADAPVVMVMVS